MKKLLALFIALAAVLTFAGCNKGGSDTSGDISRAESADETSEASDGSSVVQTKYFGDAEVYTDEDGKEVLLFKTANWGAFEADKIDEEFTCDFLAEWKELSDRYNYLALELSEGEGLKMFPYQFETYRLCRLTAAFGTYTYVSSVTAPIDESLIKAIPKIAGRRFTFEIDADTPNLKANEIVTARLIYGIRPRPEDVMAYRSGMQSLWSPDTVINGGENWLYVDAKGNNNIQLIDYNYHNSEETGEAVYFTEEKWKELVEGETPSYAGELFKEIGV